MRRPLLLFFYALAAGIMLGFYTKIHWFWLAAVLAVLLGAALLNSIYIQKQEPYSSWFRVCAVLTALFVLLGFGLVRVQEAKRSVLEPYFGAAVSCTGVVTGCRVKPDYVQLQVRLASAGMPAKSPMAASEKVLVRWEVSEPMAGFELVGRRISFSGMAQEPSARRNPGDFDYRLYLKGKGIRAIVSVNPFRLQTGTVAKPLLNYLSVQKGSFFLRAQELLGNEAFSILSGLMFGEKGFLDEDLYEEFKINGIAHVLAVSGLHVGLVYGLVLKALGRRRTPGADLGVLVSLGIYTALSGFSLSVLRAAVMIALNLLAFRIRRRYDMVSAASFTALLFSAAVPYAIFDSGFQLSFAAAYAIGIALPWAENRITALADKKRSDLIFLAGTLLVPGLLIQLAMLPLVLYHFLCWSPLSFLINPAAIFLAGLILPFGLIFFLLIWALKGFSSAPLNLFVYGAAGPVKAFCGALARLSGLAFRAGSSSGLAGFAPAPPLTALLLFYALFFWFCSETRHILRRKNKTGPLAVILLLLAVLPCACPWLLGITADPLPASYGWADLTFLDVGQGDSIHISAKGFHMLVDGGGSRYRNAAEKTLLPYLLKNGVTGLELCVVTHLDTDHSLGLAQLSEHMKIRTFAFPAGLEGDPGLESFRSENRIFLKEGDEIRVSEDLKLTVLNPSAEQLSSDANEGSLVLLAEIKGVRALLTGDAGEETEGRLVARYKKALDADILKAGHHGSAGSTSPAFLRASDPSFAVISCGKNNSYGHPSARVIDLLQKNSIIYGRTDEMGALVIRIGKRAFTVEDPAKETIWRISKSRQLLQNIPSEQFEK